MGDSSVPVSEEWYSGLSLEIWQVKSHITFMRTKACMQDLEAELFICSSHVRAVVEMEKKKKKERKYSLSVEVLNSFLLRADGSTP